MRKFQSKYYTGIVFLIILASLGLRLFKVNEIPSGFYWDEAAITYNAFGISEWNRDEWGHKLPISFQSFGDYKSPLLIYFISVLYKIFGLHIDWLRYVSAFIGAGNVLLTYILFKKIFPKSLPNTNLMAILFISLTPWYFHFSRFGNEASLSLFLTLAGSISFISAQKNPTWYLPSALFFSSSLYAYHSAKLFSPLLMLLLAFNFRHSFKKNLKVIIPSILLGAGLLLPLASDTVSGSGFERGKSLIFYENGNLAPINSISQKLFTNIHAFSTIDFWVQGKDSIGARHGLPGFGVLFYTQLGLLMVGIYMLIFKKENSAHRWLIIASLLGILPSILSNDSPHAIRSMLAAPWIACIIFFTLDSISKTKLFIHRKLAVALIISLALIFESARYIVTYFSWYPRISAPEFQYGYKQAFEYIWEHRLEADTFVFTDALGQPYIYTLLYRGITPEEYKFGALANYEFHAIQWPDARERRMYVATPQEIPPDDPSVVHIINFPTSTEPALVIALN